jgi:hypothetical protein
MELRYRWELHKERKVEHINLYGNQRDNASETNDTSIFLVMNMGTVPQEFMALGYIRALPEVQQKIR